MLKIFFGEMDTANYGPTWFQYNYSPEWFKDPFIQEMVEDVDHSRYLGGLVIESPVLGPIPPEKLSGGLQTLIMILKKPDLVFDATSCGENCAKWLLEIGNKQDVTVNLNYLMPFGSSGNFEILIVNEDKIVRNKKEYVYTAMNYV